MLALATPPECHAKIADYYAVHREIGPFHFRAVTDGDFAYTAWSGTHSGGEGVFRRRNGRWCVIVNGGGDFRIDEMVEYGVPRAIAQRLSAKMKRQRG
jgi:hypothetical protein